MCVCVYIYIKIYDHKFVLKKNSNYKTSKPKTKNLGLRRHKEMLTQISTGCSIML